MRNNSGQVVVPEAINGAVNSGLNSVKKTLNEKTTTLVTDSLVLAGNNRALLTSAARSDPQPCTHK